ncbi:uncharacterized protein LOC132200814 [Neocloeon triangulifer]|uniref:uncharacterized protein LOC132200814 n=1 Tax=Neocloeon triangulifer TaxID=2078957 RepID=UPI00286F7074|nr:uncharacterized protein LOC132200814 [Neocloeon triangulifer]
MMGFIGLLVITAVFSAVCLKNAKGSLIVTYNDVQKKCYNDDTKGDVALQWTMLVDHHDNLKSLRFSTLEILPKKDKIPVGSSKLEGWNIMSSSNFSSTSFGQIVDIRWNNVLKEAEVNQNKKYEIKLEHNRGTRFEQHFSLLARNSITIQLSTSLKTYTINVGQKFDKINITNNDVIKNGYITWVDGILGKFYHTNPEIVNGLQWRPIVLHIDEKNKLTFTLAKDYEVEFEIEGNANKLLFLAKESNSFYFVKHHMYDMRVAPATQEYLKMTIDGSGKTCLTVTYFTQNRDMMLELIGANEQKMNVVLKKRTGQWQVERIVAQFGAGKVQMKIRGQSIGDDIQAVGAVRLCTAENEYFVQTLEDPEKKTRVAYCSDQANSLGKVELKTNNGGNIFGTPEQKTFEKFLKEINMEQIEEQPGWRICGTTKCSCLRGFHGTDCKTKCADKSYSFGCTQPCGECIDNKCSPITGMCLNTLRCNAYYRPPSCTEKLLASNVAPKIKGIYAAYVEVDIKDGVTTLKNSEQRDKIEKLQLLANCTNTCNAGVVKMNIPWPIEKPESLQKLEGLNSNTSYSIKLLVLERKVQDINLNSKAALFSTKTCEPNSAREISALSNTSISIKWQEGSKFCPPQDYRVELEKVEEGKQLETMTVVGAKVIGNLDALTTYKVKIKLGNAFIGDTVTVKTLEGVPEAPDIDVKSDSVELDTFLASWRKPRMNGNFKNYVVHLKHHMYRACGNAKSANPKLDQFNTTTETTVSFNNLAPYSTYHLIVYANNEKHEGQKATKTINTRPETAIKAAPRIDSDETDRSTESIDLHWHPPDCSKAGCEIDTKFRVKFYKSPEEIIIKEVIQTHNEFVNLTKETVYNVSIEARCTSTSKWLDDPEQPNILITEIGTATFTGWELTAMILGPILLLLLIAALIAFAFWKYRNRLAGQGLFSNKMGTAEENMHLRYLPTPKRKGELVEKDQFGIYMRKAKSSGSLKKGFDMLPRGQLKSWTVGTAAANMAKNRYAKLAAYDHSRVMLGEQADYINANYISDHLQRRAYIATQGPMERTTPDFWHMVWQEEVSCIVMLTQLKEKTERCHKYWPDLNENATYKEYLVQSMEENKFADHTVRKFLLTGRMGSREVQQLHYTAWPHQGVPSDIQSFATFMTKVHNQPKMPLLVHCSGGTGRTGTVILIDLCLRNYINANAVNVWATLEKMRNERINVVETKEQYEFAHNLLEYYLAHNDLSWGFQQ